MCFFIVWFKHGSFIFLLLVSHFCFRLGALYTCVVWMYYNFFFSTTKFAFCARLDGVIVLYSSYKFINWHIESRNSVKRLNQRLLIRLREMLYSLENGPKVVAQMYINHTLILEYYGKEKMMNGWDALKLAFGLCFCELWFSFWNEQHRSSAKAQTL